MTVFLTPDARPFFGGTYYPKPTFLQLMNAVDDAWRNRRDDINGNVEALVENIGRTSQIRQSGDKASIDAFRAAVAQYDSTFDSQWGGFGGAPKFPGTMALELLLRAYLNDESPRTREMITTTLDAMASGGMYDHLGGGFARYSVDEKWLVPHFEKMLYDQALLLRPYLHASLVWRDERYRQVVHETIEYVLRELRSPEGGFYSAQDADSLDEAGHSHEGHFYVFTPDQVRRIVPAHLSSSRSTGTRSPTRATSRASRFRVVSRGEGNCCATTTWRQFARYCLPRARRGRIPGSTTRSSPSGTR